MTSPIGVALILGMVLLGATVALTAAATVVDDTQRGLDADRAEQGLTQLDSKIALVGLGEARTQQTTLSGLRGGAYELRDDAGWMNVTVTNVTSGATETMFNTSMGAVVFDNGERSVAYQGGGVWRGTTNDGSFMISPPEFHYRDATLTLPLVTVDGDQVLGERVAIQRNGSSVQHFPNASADASWQNPLDHGVVNVTVNSRYYQAWGRYWETRTDGDVVYDHGAQTATVTLVVPAGPRRVTSAISGTAAGGNLYMSGSGSDVTRTDSYNSSQGDYASTRGGQGRIVTAGDVTATGNSLVDGTVESGGFVEVKGASEITGDVRYTDGKNIRGTVGGSVSQISGVEGDGLIDGYVNRRYESIADDNDNGATSAISGDTLTSGSATFGPGRYHLEELHLDGGTLTLDTGSDEVVELGIRDHTFIEDGGEIRIEGTGQARIFADAQATGPSGHHFGIDTTGGTVDVADQHNATQFWLYGPRDFQAAVDGSSGPEHRIEGVVYAPGGVSGSSTFEIGHGDLYGSVVAGDVTMNTGGAVHFDRALLDQRALPPDESIVRLTYMHVTHTRVNVTG